MPRTKTIKITRDVEQYLEILKKRYELESYNQAIKKLIEITQKVTSSKIEEVTSSPSDRVTQSLNDDECLVGKLGNGYWVICGQGSLGVVPNPCELEEKLGLKILNHKCR